MPDIPNMMAIASWYIHYCFVLLAGFLASLGYGAILPRAIASGLSWRWKIPIAIAIVLGCPIASMTLSLFLIHLFIVIWLLSLFSVQAILEKIANDKIEAYINLINDKTILIASIVAAFTFPILIWLLIFIKSQNRQVKSSLLGSTAAWLVVAANTFPTYLDWSNFIENSSDLDVGFKVPYDFMNHGLIGMFVGGVLGALFGLAIANRGHRATS